MAVNRQQCFAIVQGNLARQPGSPDACQWAEFLLLVFVGHANALWRAYMWKYLSVRRLKFEATEARN